MRICSSKRSQGKLTEERRQGEGKQEMNDEQTEEPRWMKSFQSYISATPKITVTTLT